MDLPDDNIGTDEYEEGPQYDFCPKCGREYDEIDHEYQICHYCKYNASNETNADI